MYSIAYPLLIVASGQCPFCGLNSSFVLAGCIDLIHGDTESHQFRTQSRSVPKMLAQGRRCIGCKKAHVAILEGQTVVFKWPLGELNPPDGVPELVSTAFSEAVMCHHAHCLNATVAMVRATLETIVRDKGETDKRDKLDEKIQKLHAKGIISQDLLDQLMTLKTVGNAGAHYDDALPVSEEDAKVSVELLRLLLFDLYQVPAKRSALRSRRGMKPL